MFLVLNISLARNYL